MEHRTRHRLSLPLITIPALLLAAGLAAAESRQAEQMLAAHNEVRSQHGLPALGWSKTLSRESAKWAKHLARREACQMVHGSTGENLYWASPLKWSDGRTELQAITPETVVQSWAAEKADYDYASNRCHGEQCGHYTQIVWRDTTEVGCARQICADQAQLWVCRYSPAGNVIGQRPY